VVASGEELNVAVVVEAEVWWKRSERSGSGDSVRDFRMAIVPPRTGREVSVPHIFFYLRGVLSIQRDVDVTLG
jgi:hypothetical protein